MNIFKKVAGPSLWRGLRNIGIIAAIVAALDFAIAQLVPVEWLDPAERARKIDQQVHDRAVHYHHAFLPNVGPLQRQFGSIVYEFKTDRFGFVTGACAGNDPKAAADSSVFVLGDSFTEGMGLPFEQTFPGLMACEWHKHGMTVWNLGAQSYSPIIYYHRILDAVAKTGIRPKEIFVFLDISDIPDELTYEETANGRVITSAQAVSLPTPRLLGIPLYKIGRFYSQNFVSGALVIMLRNLWAGRRAMTNHTRGNWTFSPDQIDTVGTKGLARAAASLDRIVSLCRDWSCKLTLVVYPWPNQIIHDDRESIQVAYWRDWASSRQVRFINAFPAFFAEPKEVALRKYFLPGDFHFSAAGSKLLFDEVVRQVWQ